MDNIEYNLQDNQIDINKNEIDGKNDIRLEGREERGDSPSVDDSYDSKNSYLEPQITQIQYVKSPQVLENDQGQQNGNVSGKKK